MYIYKHYVAFAFAKIPLNTNYLFYAVGVFLKLRLPDHIPRKQFGYRHNIVNALNFTFLLNFAKELP